jgi:hypothetical protein
MAEALSSLDSDIMAVDEVIAMDLQVMLKNKEKKTLLKKFLNFRGKKI